jgi:hypothetical protein
MTATVYQGVGCPWCGPGADVTGDGVEIEHCGASQEVFCLQCEREWSNNYNFAGTSYFPEEGGDEHVRSD